MAYQEAQGSVVLGGSRRIAHRLQAAFGRVANAFAYASLVNQRLYLVDRLQAKFDRELAKLDIERDDILQHVFREQDDR